MYSRKYAIDFGDEPGEVTRVESAFPTTGDTFMSVASYGQLLKIFFSVAHDPTELNRQGPDEGTQYRSAIFYMSNEQKQIADEYIAKLTAAKAFRGPIVTQVAPLAQFWPAEDYHQ